jgi:hypothetical protein
MMSEEDTIKYKIYEKFNKNYFLKRKDKKTRFMQLTNEQALEFCYNQKLFIEEEYMKIKKSNKLK